MWGSFSAELLKLRKRSAILIVAILFVLVLVLLQFALPYLIYKNPPPNFSESLPKGTTVADLFRALYPHNFHRIALSSANGLGASIALILGVLAAGSEYGWGTYKTIFTQKPGRLTVFLAKILALVVVTAILAVLVLSAAAASSAVLALLDGQALQWPDALTIFQAAGSLWLMLVVWTALGVLLSVAFEQSALAIGIGMGYTFVVEVIVFGIFGNNPTLLNIEKFFPGANAQALADAFGQAARGRFGGGSGRPALVDPTRAVVDLLAFAAAFVVISSVLISRRDLA
jgi:ABC-type transport system involved in multi-copper enzyme maturation permease subunit